MGYDGNCGSCLWLPRGLSHAERADHSLHALKTNIKTGKSHIDVVDCDSPDSPASRHPPPQVWLTSGWFPCDLIIDRKRLPCWNWTDGLPPRKLGTSNSLAKQS